MKRFRIHIPLFVFLILLLLTLCRPQHSTIRVMTFNLHHCEGIDSVYNVRRIAGFMHQHRADLIGCQEVDNGYSERSGNENQPRILKDLLGFHGFYGPNISTTYGNLTLSRIPLIESANIPLPNPRELEPRGIIHSTFAIDGDTVSFLNTHLSAYSAENRAEHIHYLQKLIYSIRHPVIFAADFNTRPSQQLQPLLASGLLYSTRTLLDIDEGIDDILVSESLLNSVLWSICFAQGCLPEARYEINQIPEIPPSQEGGFAVAPLCNQQEHVGDLHISQRCV